MDNTARSEEIGIDDPSSVDENRSINDCDVDVATTKGRDRAIAEGAAVCNSTIDDVILKYTR